MKCPDCGTTKSRKWRKDYCDSCYLKRWRKENNDSVSKYNRTLEVRFRHSERIAKRRRIEWKLSFQEFIDICSKPCHYCLNKLSDATKTCAGIDRIDNNLGYIPSNIIPSCKVCNLIRNEFLTVQETEQMINLLLKLRNL
jgi:hypothetical protein